MATRYIATDASGTEHTRTSKAGRVYTHCVVFHVPARDKPILDSKGNEQWPPRPGYDRTAWAGSLALAEKTARSHWCNQYGGTTEIVPAQVAHVSRPRT